jgi:hypothetical protein
VKNLVSKLVLFTIASTAASLLFFSLVALPLWYLELFMWFTALMAPDPVLLVASIYYLPVVVALTCWWGIWRILRAIEKKGPLKEFFYLLVVLWLPVTLVPAIWLGLLLVMIAAYAAMTK